MTGTFNFAALKLSDVKTGDGIVHPSGVRFVVTKREADRVFMRRLDVSSFADQSYYGAEFDGIAFMPYVEDRVRVKGK